MTQPNQKTQVIKYPFPLSQTEMVSFEDRIHEFGLYGYLYRLVSDCSQSKSPKMITMMLEGATEKILAAHTEDAKRMTLEELKKIYGDDYVYIKVPGGFVELDIRIAELEAELNAHKEESRGREDV